MLIKKHIKICRNAAKTVLRTSKINHLNFCFEKLKKKKSKFINPKVKEKITQKSMKQKMANRENSETKNCSFK